MTPPPTLHFLCGKAGAGKSTLAAHLAREHHAILVCEDIWLARLYGEQMKTFDDYLRVARLLKTVIAPLVVDLLRAGQSVVLDFPANTKAGRTWFRSVIDEAKSAHVLHCVSASNEVCLAGIAKRNLERPEGSHVLTKAQFLHISSFFQAPEADEGFNLQAHSR